jgi:transaldolase
MSTYRIKLYADGADLDDIRRLNHNDAVSGFTTNPTLMAKAGVTNFEEFAREAASIVAPKPISLEVFADDLDEMKRQALKLNTLGENVYVKIPISNTQGVPTSGLIRELSHAGVKLNVTAIFTEDQVISTIDALKGGADSVVSVFAGRIADAGVDPVPMMAKFAQLTAPHSGMELLWASPREILNLIQADEVGCDIITMTPDLFGKLSTLGKDLAEFSLDTVKMFYGDALKSGFSI